MDVQSSNKILKQQQNDHDDFLLFDLILIRDDNNTSSTTNPLPSNHNTKEDKRHYHNYHNECYKELIRRNTKRLIETGRYIPCHVIYDMKIRSKQMIQTTIKQ